jgi:hypothetical protein
MRPETGWSPAPLFASARRPPEAAGEALGRGKNERRTGFRGGARRSTGYRPSAVAAPATKNYRPHSSSASRATAGSRFLTFTQ